jgi:FkbM family methyltransferase
MPAQRARAEMQPGDAMPSQDAPADAIDGGHGLDWGFNRVLASQDRSERIFAFHANRLGIGRILDIGSNSGQFAAKMRRFGYDGIIYSVEPQSAAHLELRNNAQSDVRWIPLSRQAAGRVQSKLDLNLSENSWSSSLLPVHENHVRAAPGTRTVGRERVFVTKTADLLHEPLMRRIDALKIDVQGYEQEVLEGLRPCIDGIRLLLLEMSLVECYSGAPDLFALDRFLVEELGFERISFEPSYYDDRAGVVQQFDGIYAKKRTTGTIAATDGPCAFGATVTSMHGVPSRVSRSGEELGREWLDLCVESWVQFSYSVISVSERAPPDAQVRWAQTNARPSIAELFDAMPQDGDTHTVLCNADILVSEELMRLSARLDPAAVYLAHRVDVEFNDKNPQLLDSKEMYEFGFDLFLLPPEFVRFVRDSRVLPPEFLIGQPWWDYLVPLAALAGGFPVKRLPCSQALALHHRHPVQYDNATWTKLGETFLATVAGLASQFSSRRCDVLEDIAALSGPLDVKLAAICGIVCSRLP